MDLKTCGTCKIEFPKTEEYFFKRTIKQQNKNGLAVYYSFKSQCKKCHGLQGNNIRVKKRCLEMNCEVLDYNKNWRKQYSDTRILFKEITYLPQGVQNVVRRKIQNGYVFSTYEQYRIDCRKNLSKVRRKYDYGDLDFVPKGTQTGIKHLTDGYIALTMGLKVKEVPKEFIETRRLTILLKRELEKQKTI
tara:strand:- start:2876 stop:3445 length:570 start_codon:yes stop_codon:yes gene_type:complete